MTRFVRTTMAATSIIGAAFAWCPAASAQPYPSRPIHIIVPFAAGGITDVIGRALGQRLAEAFGQQVVVENKPGGGTGQVGTEYVAKSAPDGYTLLVTADATFVTAPHVYGKLPYDALNDFVPITALGISPQALVVHPSLPARTVGELVELAKSKPGAINYGTFGIGSSGHLNIILIEGMTGTKFTPVHYRGAAPGITDLIGGHIQMMIVSIGLVRQAWQAGQLKVLGFGSTTRLAQFPELPTVGETLPGFTAVVWFGLFAPSGTPREIVVKINNTVQRILADRGFRDRFLTPNFYEPISGSPEQFAEDIHRDAERWQNVIRDAKLAIED